MLPFTNFVARVVTTENIIFYDPFTNREKKFANTEEGIKKSEEFSKQQGRNFQVNSLNFKF